MSQLVRPNRASRSRWVLGAPLLIFLAAVVLFPLGYGLFVAGQDRSLLNPDPSWIGLDNIAAVVQDSSFWRAVRFTVIYTVVVTSVELILGFLLALLFNRRFPGKRLLLSLTILPVMIAPALMGIMFRLLLNQDIGLVPSVLSVFGWEISLFGTDAVVPMLLLLDVLQWTPFAFLLFYAGMQSVPDELYEAASIDGSGYWRSALAITVPLLLPVAVVTAFLRGVDAFRTFDVVYVLTGGGPGDYTTNVSIYIYKAFSSGNFGIAAAASVVVCLILLPVVPVVVRRLADPARS
ncbi:carbohydrate ABC transporter permease [Phytoactinopolyspora limicola]|uniref:carbohydrate ABC transporter permease n=1 Tax=Phytoactinopolyspora limicola TaxID=2715536 RepID=UPI00140DD612|nr:sugar ABC transporter permease [Phytoactinopolyspora limicola]